MSRPNQTERQRNPAAGMSFEERFSHALVKDFGTDFTNLDGKLSYNWFQEHGLLKEVVSIYRGQIPALLGITRYEDKGINQQEGLDSAVRERASYRPESYKEYMRLQEERKSMTLTPQTYIASRAVFGLVDKPDATFDEACEDLYAFTLKHGGTLPRVRTIAQRTYNRFGRTKVQNVFDRFSTEEAPAALPFTEEQLNQLTGYSQETGDFFRRLGERYPEKTLDEIKELIKEQDGLFEDNKDIISRREYLSFRARFKLVERENASFKEAVAELCADQIKDANDWTRLTATLNGVDIYGLSKKIGIALEEIGSSLDSTLPFNEEQLSRIRETSTSMADLLERLGEKYPDSNLRDLVIRRRLPKVSRKEIRPLSKNDLNSRSETTLTKDGSLPEGAEQIKTAEFWADFETDILSVLPARFTFRNFMDGFVDTVSGVKFQPDRAKYSSLYKTLDNHFYLQLLRGENIGLEDTPREKIIGAFFANAPTHIKALLLDRFPKEFSRYEQDFIDDAKILIEKWDKEGVAHGLLPALLDFVSKMPQDRRLAVAEVLTNYLSNKSDQTGQYESEALRVFFEQMLRRHGIRKASGFSGELNLQDILNRFSGLAKLQDEATSDGAIETEQLLNSIESNVLIPTVLSAIYKPVSLYWNRRFSRKDHSSVSAEDIDNFVTFFLKKGLMTARLETSKENGQIYDSAFENYFISRILPRMRSHFRQIAWHRKEIAFLNPEGKSGEPKYLFLHQVEAIKALQERGGGVLADEPGSGKTLTLALAALNMVETKRLEGKTNRRILVVGGKTVVDNWENELQTHIFPESYRVINLNTPPDPKKPYERLDENRRLRDRLNAFREALLTKGPTAVALVNYDVFRDQYFRDILQEFQFDVCIVDEAQHVKARDIKTLKHLNEEDGDTKSSVASRTMALYRFIRENPEMAVFFATATPFVKTTVEPLILAHLVDQENFSAENIEELQSDNRAVHEALRRVMIRRRKIEVADLPQKETKFIPIDLSKLPPSRREAFRRTAETMTENAGENVFALFYSLLSLEGQAKLAWLRDKVWDLTQERKKVIIFTPFIQSKDRFTGPISTAHIARYLQQAGIANVGILDGSLDLEDRDEIQKQFKLPTSTEEGLDVLVGNYQTAGESITLCSPDNNASEVIIFIGPNTVAKLIQGIDRVHRFGQTEKVTIHVPFVTGDILDREGGTYDERVFRRLYGELVNFNQVIDGIFFEEPPDIYQDIAKGTAREAELEFEPDEIIEQMGIRMTGERKPSRKAATTVKIFTQAEIKAMIGNEEDWIQNMTAQHLHEINAYELLTAEQEVSLGRQIRSGRQAKNILDSQKDSQRLSPTVLAQLEEKAAEGERARELFLKSNLRLVVSVAKKYPSGLPLLDRIQDGTIGLMRALEKWDLDRGFKFSTYAVHWIRQAVTRGGFDSSRIVRVPVHVAEHLHKIANAFEEFESETGRSPTDDEILDTFIDDDTKSHKASNIRSALETYKAGVYNQWSLDKPIIGKHGVEDSEFGEILADLQTDVEQEGFEAQTANEIQNIIERVLRPDQIDIVRRRYLEPRRSTLQDIGFEIGVTRERVRQLESAALKRLKGHGGLKRLWEQSVVGRVRGERYSFTLEGKSPEGVMFHERTRRSYSRRYDILTEAIFDLRPLYARIAYGRLFHSLSNEEIGKQLEMTPEDVGQYFDRARLRLWERLFPEGVEGSPIRSRLIYFPQLDPRELEEKFNLHKNDLDIPSRRVLRAFFGFGARAGTYDILRTSRKLRMKRTHVRRYLRDGIELLEKAEA